jgi:hypothetical protein
VSRSQPSDAQGTRGRCNEGGDGGTVWALIGWIVTDVSCWSVHLLVCTVAVDWLLKIEHHVIEQALLQTRPVLTKPTRSILTKPLVPFITHLTNYIHVVRPSPWTPHQSNQYPGGPTNYTAVSESLLDPDDEPEDVDSDSVEPSEEFESLSQLPDELLES